MSASGRGYSGEPHGNGVPHAGRLVSLTTGAGTYMSDGWCVPLVVLLMVSCAANRADMGSTTFSSDPSFFPGRSSSCHEGCKPKPGPRHPSWPQDALLTFLSSSLYASLVTLSPSFSLITRSKHTGYLILSSYVISTPIYTSAGPLQLTPFPNRHNAPPNTPPPARNSRNRPLHD